ncbi:hypothetical protein BGZ60DRAFT_187241 [Tricladium varicosporioides]|nr:hypothetical protein BGZ60DRAFT_187241 [Hymenoscyphus varicosporioides]
MSTATQESIVQSSPTSTTGASPGRTEAEGQKVRKTRASKPKVKTGCQTCKIRRVKCDETKPACLRCVRFGHKCDGYLNKTGRSGNSSGNSGNARVLVPKGESVGSPGSSGSGSGSASGNVGTNNGGRERILLPNIKPEMKGEEVSRQYGSTIGNWADLPIHLNQHKSMSPPSITTPQRSPNSGYRWEERCLGVGTLRHFKAWRDWKRGLCYINLGRDTEEAKTSVGAALLLLPRSTAEARESRRWDETDPSRKIEVHMLLESLYPDQKSHVEKHCSDPVLIPERFSTLSQAGECLECLNSKSLSLLRDSSHFYKFLPTNFQRSPRANEKSRSRIFIDLAPETQRRQLLLEEFRRWERAFSSLLIRGGRMEIELRLCWLAGFLVALNGVSGYNFRREKTCNQMLSEIIDISRRLDDLGRGGIQICARAEFHNEIPLLIVAWNSRHVGLRRQAIRMAPIESRRTGVIRNVLSWLFSLEDDSVMSQMKKGEEYVPDCAVIRGVRFKLEDANGNSFSSEGKGVAVSCFQMVRDGDSLREVRRQASF